MAGLMMDRGVLSLCLWQNLESYNIAEAMNAEAMKTNPDISWLVRVGGGGEEDDDDEHGEAVK